MNYFTDTIDYHGKPLGWHVYDLYKKRTIYLGAGSSDCVEWTARTKKGHQVAIRGPHKG